MPVTFFAHQAPLVPLKIYRPSWFDATALCAGSMIPDLMYAFTPADIDTNHWTIITTRGVPIALALTVLLRYVVVPVAAAHLPDVGPARLRSLAVVELRRPNPAITLLSAAIAVYSHALLDWFTHDDRRGPRTLGYADVHVSIGEQDRTLAQVLQLIGHSVGGALGLWALVWIGRRRMLERWYDDAAVARARAWRPATWSVVGFWACTLLGAGLGARWGDGAGIFVAIQRVAVATLCGITVWSALRRPARRSAIRRHADAAAPRIDAPPPGRLPPPLVSRPGTPAP